MANPIYSSPEELQQKVDAYFADEDNYPFKITSLCLAIGFSSRQTFYNYKKKTEFSHILETASLRIEEGHEGRLFLSEGNITGSIFALKSMGWSDAPQVEDTNENKVENLTEYDKDDFIRRFKEDY
jgi:hypothetical protein